MDLSWNDAQTQYLRFRISNSGSCSQLGGIGEIKVFGHAMEALTLLPFQTTASSEDPSYPACFLSDHDTYTSWRTQANTAQATVTFSLAGPTNLQYLKYFNENGAGLLSIEVLCGGEWLPVSMSDDLSNVPVGWQEVPINMTVSGVRFDLAQTGSCNYLGGISEVELWGQAAPAKKTLLLGQNITGITTLDFTIDNLDSNTSYALWAVVPAGISISDGNFTINLNGQQVPVAYQVYSGPGYSFIKLPLNPANLSSGQNLISGDLGTMVINEVCLMIAPPSGELDIAKVSG